MSFVKELEELRKQGYATIQEASVSTGISSSKIRSLVQNGLVEKKQIQNSRLVYLVLVSSLEKHKPKIL